MHILWLVETAQQDVAWENEDFAQLVGRVLTFVDGHGLLRRGGRDTDLAGASLRGHNFKARTSLRLIWRMPTCKGRIWNERILKVPG
jgi:hypothetical protein